MERAAESTMKRPETIARAARDAIKPPAKGRERPNIDRGAPH
jgi:hypothetical protein